MNELKKNIAEQSGLTFVGTVDNKPEFIGTKKEWDKYERLMKGLKAKKDIMELSPEDQLTVENMWESENY